MARGVEIKDGIVVSVTNFEDTPDVLEFIKYFYSVQEKTGFHIPDDTIVDVGYIYEDGKFTPPPVPEPTREELIVNGYQERYTRMTEVINVLTTGTGFIGLVKEVIGESDEERKQRIRSLITYYEGMEVVDIETDPYNIQWPDRPSFLPEIIP